jgi:2-polyprenyl-3-methyl-5-hydroxy-6-metoxy-1,4-benzoquinol methylase
MNYKDELFKSYVTTHTGKRKGVIDLKKLHYSSIAFRQHFKKFLPEKKTAKVADLGCGTGALVWWLHQEGFYNATGIDVSIEQVDQARSMGIDNISLENVFEFIDKETNFDLLFARDLIEHFENQTLYDFLIKCNSALSTQGKLVLQIPNAESPYFGRIRYGDFTHELAFTSSSITQLLAATGFTKINVYPWRPVIVGLKSFLRYILWRLMEALLKLPVFVESGKSNTIVTMNIIVEASKSMKV